MAFNRAGMMSAESVEAWHFTGNYLRDGTRVPEPGEVLHHEGPLRLCRSGLHASVKLLDAVRYAPGDDLVHLHRVVLSGDMMNGFDKIVATERMIEWTLEPLVVHAVLREFIRWCGLQVLEFTGMDPESAEIMRTYLEDPKAGDYDRASEIARYGRFPTSERSPQKSVSMAALRLVFADRPAHRDTNAAVSWVMQAYGYAHGSSDRKRGRWFEWMNARLTDMVMEAREREV